MGMVAMERGELMKPENQGISLKEFVANYDPRDSSDEESAYGSDDEGNNPVQQQPEDNRELNKDIKRYFSDFIKDLKKPTEKDIKPYLEIMAEKFPNCEHSWRYVRDKVYSYVKHIKRQAKKTQGPENNSKSVSKRKEYQRKKSLSKVLLVYMYVSR